MTNILAVAPIVLLGWVVLAQTSSAPGTLPQYTSDGQLRLLADYRDWVYLSSGLDMSYDAKMDMDHHMFDNVFVNPEAWRTFKATGTWPDKTYLVLELRHALSKGSINQKGNFQDSDVMGVEVHIKDKARFKGDWTFFGFSGKETTAKMIPAAADCYSCHRDHGAVDTTFVQFYPTALPIATEKKTLTPAYQHGGF